MPFSVFLLLFSVLFLSDFSFSFTVSLIGVNCFLTKTMCINKEQSPQPTPKFELHWRKVISCVCGGVTELLLLFLEHNETLNVHLYAQQLQCVLKGWVKKRWALFKKKYAVLLQDSKNNTGKKWKSVSLFYLARHIHLTFQLLIIAVCDIC